MHRGSTSVVHHLEVPEEGILTTASATCNEMVVDPTCQQTLLTPYIDSDHNAALGLWSLKSGTFAGKKILAKNPERDAMFVELCPTTTASFSCRGESGSKGHRNPSDFGVWLKCGRFSISRA